MVDFVCALEVGDTAPPTVVRTKKKKKNGCSVSILRDMIFSKGFEVSRNVKSENFRLRRAKKTHLMQCSAVLPKIAVSQI